MRHIAVCAALLLAASACAGTGSPRASSPLPSAAGAAEPGSPRRNPNVITRAEIERTGASDVYSVIRRLRPRWLELRGRDMGGDVIHVYRDEAPAGTAASLSAMNITDVREIRYVPPRLARGRYGNNHQHGVIQVYTVATTH